LTLDDALERDREDPPPRTAPGAEVELQAELA
jgi:hypothetical protein